MDFLLHNAYWIALLPALSFPINLAKKFKEPIPAFIGWLLIGLAWLWSVALFVTTLHTPDAYSATAAWMPALGKPLQVGFLVDHMTVVMLLVVTTVSALVQIYSREYMHGDPRFNRFYAFLGLFTAAMLGLVLASDWLLMMVCWELVGVSSYLLIGFWFEKPSAMRAAKKAFVVTRLADLGFLIGVIIIWHTFHTFNIREVFALMNPANTEMIRMAGAAAMLMFVGACGKSAQFPLHVWLPDAMEGPTPVSALIHAATMVAAGVYLVGRSFPLFEYGSLHTFHWIFGIGVTPLGMVRFLGVCTLFIAATIAVAQNDIKRVLAYSTVSQLGYMVMGIGLGSWVAGLFHLMTHAAFKALLFLGSGSVIHGTGTQDMREMGGLAKKMPKTFWTYLIGYLALAGFPLVFAGFWSKDAILDGAKLLMTEHRGLYFVLGSIGALLTPFYMTRQMLMVFAGKQRNPALHAHGHSGVHESGGHMTVPLILLSLGAIGLGWVGIPSHNLFKEYLAPPVPPAPTASVSRMVAQAPGSEIPSAVPAEGHGPAAGEGAHGEAAAEELPAYLRGVDLTAPGIDPALRLIHAPEESTGFYFGLNPSVAIPSSLIALFGILLGWLIYKSAVNRSEAIAATYASEKGLSASHGHGHDAHGHGGVEVDPSGFWKDPLAAMGPIWGFLENKWWIDELYWWTVVTPYVMIAGACAWFDKHVIDGIVNCVGLLGVGLSHFGKWIDTYIVDGIVNGLGWISNKIGRNVRYVQTGRVQNYAVILYLGALLLIALGLFRLH